MRYYAKPGATFEVPWTNAPEGLLGDITVRLFDPTTGFDFVPSTNVGITEPEPGNYMYSGVAPDVKDVYWLRWHDPINDVTTVDELEVTYNPPASGAADPGGGPYYATVQDFRNYILPETTSLDDESIAAALSKAESDLDDFLGGGEPEVNGRLFGDPFAVDGVILNTLDLESWQMTRLRKATCAQAQYRLHWGEEFFILPQTPVEGEEYSTEKKLPHFAPNAKTHLRSAGLISMLSRLS